MKTLIISDDFFEPPNETLVLRTISMIAHEDLNMDVLLHTTQAMKDTVYHFAKPRGLMDYIDYILNEYEFENGVRLDTIKVYPNTIVVKSLRLENQLRIVGQVKRLAGIE
jgi:hypothetical protein